MTKLQPDCFEIAVEDHALCTKVKAEMGEAGKPIEISSPAAMERGSAGFQVTCPSGEVLAEFDRRRLQYGPLAVMVETYADGHSVRLAHPSRE